MQRRCGGDRGQALPLLVVVVLLAGAVGLAVVRLGSAQVGRARAQAAADAAALAGVVHDRPTAAAVARRDGAELVGFRRLGTDVVVTVRLRGTDASARARAVRTTTPRHHDPDRPDAGARPRGRRPGP